MSLNHLSLLMMGSSLICLFLSSYAWNAWKRKHDLTALSLSLLVAAVAIWSFFYGLEFSLAKLSLMRVAVAVSYVGIAAIPVLWFVFAARYSGNDQWLKPSNIALLFIIPAVSVAMVATNGMHGLFYSTIELGLSDGYTFLRLQMGPFWWVNIVYSYVWVIAGLVLMIRMLLKASGMNRLRIGLILAGALFPYAVNMAYVSGFRPYGFLDLTPAAFAVTGLMLTVGIFTMNLFDINPVARDMLFDSIPDAVLVLDTNARVIEANPTARTLLKSRFVRETVAVAKEEPEGPPGGFFTAKPDERDFSVEDKTYHRTSTELFSRGGRRLGSLIVIRDITERKRVEERLVEANRRLHALTERLEDAREEERAAVAWELHDHVAQALSVVKIDVAYCRSRLDEESLASLATTMDEMTRLLDETVGRLRRLYTDLVPVMLEDLGLAATIEWQAEEFARLSGMECEARRVEDLTLPRGRVALGMFRVLREALDNVQRHSGATRVTVDFEREGDDAVLRVADNGRGFTVGAAGKPGAIGLADIQERVLSWGGRMRVNSSVGAGTVIEVTAPLGDEPAGSTVPESPDI
ncbi:MAG: PAS domain-containing protein [Chloroflexi bacterium]|nr:PAS domain-containing protein [Chloroflexota bacterium]